MVMFLCAGCADKISEIRNIKRIEGSDRTGQCPLCFGVYHGDCYEIGQKKRKEYRRGTGGGERGRACEHYKESAEIQNKNGRR